MADEKVNHQEVTLTDVGAHFTIDKTITKDGKFVTLIQEKDEGDSIIHDTVAFAEKGVKVPLNLELQGSRVKMTEGKKVNYVEAPDSIARIEAVITQARTHGQITEQDLANIGAAAEKEIPALVKAAPTGRKR